MVLSARLHARRSAQTTGNAAKPQTTPRSAQLQILPDGGFNLRSRHGADDASLLDTVFEEHRIQVLALDPSGNLWVSVVGANKVVEFTVAQLAATNPTAAGELMAEVVRGL